MAEIVCEVKATDLDKFKSAMDLLERVVNSEILSDCAPDASWFRDYFILIGEHAVRTEEGWELFGEGEYEPGEIEEEVNKP